ncbi:hypothetical protein TWF694_004140 [Orbilia ellipsospora]|uniref:Uncharacterized protein n=1 Tax=Orbilia ellipsospora TaxID=2528407 RepID=A0AAV9WYB8_9PEZI
MRFTSYIAVAATVFAVQVSSLPTGARPAYTLSKRDVPPPPPVPGPPVPGPPVPGPNSSMSSKIADMVKNLQSIAKALSLPKGSSLTARSQEPELEPDVEDELDESDSEVEDPTPVAGSQFNKKSATAEPHEEELDDGEEEPELVVKRAVNSGQVPGAGIPQDLPSGIVMWIIILMVYAMFTTISMKGE